MKKKIDTWTEKHGWTPPMNHIENSPLLDIDIIFPQGDKHRR